MSKWLRRVSGQNNSNVISVDGPIEESDDTSPTNRPTEVCSTTGSAVPVATSPGSSQAAIAYDSQSQVDGDMDVSRQENWRSKGQHNPRYSHRGVSPMTEKDFERSTGSSGRTSTSRHLVNEDESEDCRVGHISRSGRPSSHSSFNRSQPPSPQSYKNGPSPSRYNLHHHHAAANADGRESQHFPHHQRPTQRFGGSQKQDASPSVSGTHPGFARSYSPAEGPGEAQLESQAIQRRPAYLLHRDLVIGKGSYGQVCIASRGEAEGHSSSGRSGKRKKFACKCVMLRNDPKYIAKLQEEVNVLRELRGHENVIRLFDVFCVDNELFIITELGRGGDLFHLLTTHPKHGVTEAYAAKTVAEMLSAVAFLHSRQICHRDLKLENWVLESGKDVWSPLKLIDFGLSTHFTPGHRLSRVVGSSYYVAPEVLKKSYTESCDLWSLGVIVYMLLSGAPPFYGRNDEAIKASIVQGQYTFPRELFRDVSDDAMAFVSTLLAYNSEYRYTAEQALTHPWLAANLDPEQLQKAKDGSCTAAVLTADGNYEAQPKPMQM